MPLLYDIKQHLKQLSCCTLELYDCLINTYHFCLFGIFFVFFFFFFFFFFLFCWLSFNYRLSHKYHSWIIYNLTKGIHDHFDEYSQFRNLLHNTKKIRKKEKKTIIQCISIVVMVLCHMKQASQHILSNTN